MTCIGQRIVWAESQQHSWVVHEVNKPRDSQRREPNRHYGSEQETNSAAAPALY